MKFKQVSFYFVLLHLRKTDFWFFAYFLQKFGFPVESNPRRRTLTWCTVVTGLIELFNKLYLLKMNHERIWIAFTVHGICLFPIISFFIFYVKKKKKKIHVIFNFFRLKFSWVFAKDYIISNNLLVMLAELCSTKNLRYCKQRRYLNAIQLFLIFFLKLKKLNDATSPKKL